MARNDAPTCRFEFRGGTFHDILDGSLVRAAEAGDNAEEEVQGSARDLPLSDRQGIRKRAFWKLQEAAAAGLAAAGAAGRHTTEG
jgi:hypothetical protein